MPKTRAAASALLVDAMSPTLEALCDGQTLTE